MYNTLSNKIPKAPVVGSLFSAEKQIRQWEKSNNLSSFSGQTWKSLGCSVIDKISS